MKNICLVGGGTLGHVTPNLALVPELKNRGYNIIYIGEKNGEEEKAVVKSDIVYYGITSDKLRRYHDMKNFLIPKNVLKGIMESRKILKDNNIKETNKIDINELTEIEMLKTKINILE